MRCAPDDASFTRATPRRTLRSRATDRSRSCAATFRKPCAQMVRDRKDKRSAFAARRCAAAYRGVVAAYLLRIVHLRIVRWYVLRVQSRALEIVVRPCVRRLPERDARRGRDRTAARQCDVGRCTLRNSGIAGAGECPVEAQARCGMAARTLGGDRGNERPPVVLGARPSTGQTGFPSLRLLCARASRSVVAMISVGEDPLRRSRLRCARRLPGSRGGKRGRAGFSPPTSVGGGPKG